MTQHLFGIKFTYRTIFFIESLFYCDITLSLILPILLNQMTKLGVGQNKSWSVAAAQSLLIMQMPRNSFFY